MKMNLTCLRAGALACTLCSATLAHSADPVVFSRACQFSSWIAPVQSLYYTLTNHKNDSGTPIHQVSQVEKQQHWADEAITADYGQFRYFLLAYAGEYSDGVFVRYYTSSWVPDSVSDNNRGWLTSVRAGHGLKQNDGSYRFFEYKGGGLKAVLGAHYWVDPVSGRFVVGPGSRATDCNCREFGFADDTLNKLASIPCNLGQQ